MKNKRTVLTRAAKQEPPAAITELIRDPYVLEFVGLGEMPDYSENDPQPGPPGPSPCS